METAVKALLSTILIATGLTITGLGAATAIGELDLKSASKLLVDVFGSREKTIVIKEKVHRPQVVTSVIYN